MHFTTRELTFIPVTGTATVATAIAVYDFTQRAGKNNFSAFISFLLALAFGRWILHYARKLVLHKSGQPAGR